MPLPERLMMHLKLECFHMECPFQLLSSSRKNWDVLVALCGYLGKGVTYVVAIQLLLLVQLGV